METWTRKLRMGMVGGGQGAFIGWVHRMAAALDQQVDFVAGCFSRDFDNTRITGEQLYLDPSRCYKTYQEMAQAEAKLPANQRIDFVSIVTPNDSHFAIAKTFLEAGIHVVCDKPMTYTLEEAEELVKLVEKTGLVFALTHNYTGHPLVRRLIEEVKQSAFRDTDRYGRTAYMVTDAVDEVTALFHVLTRYLVNTEPTSIVEELLPVALPVYGGDVLGKEATHSLLTAAPSAAMRTEAEVREILSETLAIEVLDNTLERSVEARRRELVAERRAMQRSIDRRQGGRVAEWLEGIDDLSPGSFDVLAITVMYPGR